MTAVSIYDSLYFQPLPDGELRLECRWAYGLAARSQRTDMTDTGATDAGGLPPETENIVYRAVDRLRQAAERDTGPARVGAAMTLVKRIPAAAGVGGASSDAAAALLAANESWQLGWSMDRLAEFSATIGSDVPFFFTSGVRGPGTAICRGRGELVEPVHGLPRRSYVVVRPREGLSTADVYRAHRPPPDAGVARAVARRGARRGTCLVRPRCLSTAWNRRRGVCHPPSMNFTKSFSAATCEGIK